MKSQRQTCIIPVRALFLSCLVENLINDKATDEGEKERKVAEQGGKDGSRETNNMGSEWPLPWREQRPSPGCHLPAEAQFSPTDTQIVCCFLLRDCCCQKQHIFSLLLISNFISDWPTLLSFLRRQLPL